MRKVLYNGKGYSVVEIDGEMKVCFAEGMEGTIAYYDISEELFERLKKSEEDAYDVILEIQDRDRIIMDLQTLKEMTTAIKENRVDDFKRMAEENKDTFDVNAPWATFLHDAATYGSYGIAEYLIECGANVNKRAGFRYSTAMPYAAFGGHLDIVKMLYENGCKIHMDYAFENPLFAAISGGHLDVVKYLVEKGMDLSKTYSLNCEDIDACAYAKNNGKTEIFNYLQETIDKEKQKEMRLAIQQNRVDDFKRLASEHPELLKAETLFGTFLHDAAKYGNYDIAQYLIECGVDVNKKGGFRKGTALTEAASEGRLDIVKLLHENGGKFYVDSFAENPLFAAIYGRHEDVVKYLVENGIDLSPKYKIGVEEMDACKYASYYAKTKILSYLCGQLGKEPPVEKIKREVEVDLSKKPKFDYGSFEERLCVKMKETLKKYSDKRDDIYAFSIKYEPEFTSFIDILANSYSYLNECAQKGSFSLNDYKYSEEDWGIWEKIEDLSDDLEYHYELVEKWCGEDDELFEEMYEEHKKRIIDTCISVMLEIKDSEEYSLYPRLNLNVFVREGMSEDEELEIFRKLNDEQAVKEFEKFMGEG